MNIDLLDLIEAEPEEPELIPEILPMDARLSISGKVSSLVQRLQSAVSVTPAKEIIPNTIYVSIEALDSSPGSPEVVRVAATDGERSVTRETSTLSVHLAGSALLPGKRLMEILKLAGDDFRLDVFATTATVRSGRAVWTIQLPSAGHLPPFPDTESVKMHEVDARELTAALETAVQATAKSSARLALTQVQISKQSVVGCDGARLHKAFVPSLPKSFATTLPTPLVDSILKEVRGLPEGEKILLGSNASTVVLRVGKDTVTGQRLTLEYPNVDHLMLEPAMLNNVELTFSASEVREAVKRVRVNADPDLSTVYLAIRSVKSEWTMTVRAVDKAGNSSQETLPVSYTGTESREMAVNHRFFLEILGEAGPGSVTFKLGEDTKFKKSALYVVAEGFTGVLMPMTSGFST